MYAAATMTRQAASTHGGGGGGGGGTTRQQSSSRSARNLPVRSLLTCRCDSTSTVSTLSFGSEFLENDNRSVMSATGRGSSIPRIDRFKASAGTDRGLGKAPGRKGSIHKITSGVDDGNNDDPAGLSTLPPRLPSRQDTAERKKNVFADAMNDDDDDDGCSRPGLSRAAGGINVFSSKSLAP